MKTKIIMLVIGILGGLGYMYYTRTPEVSPIVPGRNDDSTFCTADAQECPDGSYVGRSGPDCAFDPCPTNTKKNPPEAGVPELE